MEKLSIFQQSTPLSRHHTRRGKNREEQDGGYLTYRNERRRSRSREDEEAAAPGRGGGQQQALGEVVTDSSSSPWTPTAEARGGDQGLVLHASLLPVKRRRDILPARAPPTGRVRRLASPSRPHPHSDRPPGGWVAAAGQPAGSDPFSGARVSLVARRSRPLRRYAGSRRGGMVSGEPRRCACRQDQGGEEW
jgi:hypothetical protein